MAARLHARGAQRAGKYREVLLPPVPRSFPGWASDEDSTELTGCGFGKITRPSSPQNRQATREHHPPAPRWWCRPPSGRARPPAPQCGRPAAPSPGRRAGPPPQPGAAPPAAPWAAARAAPAVGWAGAGRCVGSLGLAVEDSNSCRAAGTAVGSASHPASAVGSTTHPPPRWAGAPPVHARGWRPRKRGRSRPTAAMHVEHAGLSCCRDRAVQRRGAEQQESRQRNCRPPFGTLRSKTTCWPAPRYCRGLSEWGGRPGNGSNAPADWGALADVPKAGANTARA